jgi:hypothetical protein
MSVLAGSAHDARGFIRAVPVQFRSEKRLHVIYARATRVYARINEDGTLKAQPIPVEMLNALRELGDLKRPRSNSGATKLTAER